MTQLGNIPLTTEVKTASEVTSDIAAHEADTTSVHGITDTSTLYRAGGTDVAVADGGTGASTAAAARANLDVPSNSEAILDTIVDAKGDLIAATAADTVARLPVGSTGQVLTADSAETTGMKWAAAAGGGVSVGPPAVSGRMYRASPYAQISHGVQASTLNRMLYIRILLTSGTLDRVGVHHWASATAGETCRVGIYNDSNNRPGSLLIDAGTVDLSTATGLKLITISQAVSDGWYWLVSARQGGSNTATLITLPGVNQSAFGSSWAESKSTTSPHECWSAAHQDSITGAFPASATPTMISTDATPVNMVVVRYA